MMKLIKLIVPLAGDVKINVLVLLVLHLSDGAEHEAKKDRCSLFLFLSTCGCLCDSMDRTTPLSMSSQKQFAVRQT